MATILLTPDSAGACGQQGGAGSPCTDGCDGAYCSCPAESDFNQTVESTNNFQPTQDQIDSMNTTCKQRDPYAWQRNPPWAGPYYKELDPLDSDGNPTSSFDCDAKYEFIGGSWIGSKSACFQCLPAPPY